MTDVEREPELRSVEQEPEFRSSEAVELSEKSRGVAFVKAEQAPVDQLRPELDAPEQVTPAASAADSGGTQAQADGGSGDSPGE